MRTAVRALPGLVLVLLAALVPASASAQLPAGDLAERPAPATLPGDDEIFRTIEEVVSRGPRRLGTPGGRFAVDYVKERFEEYGLQDVHVEQSPAYSWETRTVDLRIGGRPVDVFPATYSQSPSARAVGNFDTPPGGLNAPVVDVGLATPAEVAAHDVRGKIVLFDLKFLLPVAGLLPFTEFLWDPEQTLLTDPKTLLLANPYITTFSDAVKAAQDAGAVGFVGVLADYFDSNRYHNEFYRRLVVKIPGMWVTKAEGARVRAQLAADPAAQANLVFETTRKEEPASAVVGVLPGRSSDAIMIQTHHDSAFQGAVEDGSGVAEVLALAKHYAAQPARTREKTLMFTTFDSHFTGYQAHFAFVRRHITHRDPARDPYRIVANVTLEHIAKAATIGDGGKLAVSDLPEPRGIFENVSPLLKTELITGIVRNDLRRTTLLNGTVFQPVGVPTDASFVLTAGIPTASLIAGPLYLYDEVDTLDKVLRSELQDVAQLFVEYIDVVDETPSEAIGIVPLSASLAVGREAMKQVTGERGTEVSVDRIESASVPSCVPAPRGRAVSGARLRRSGGAQRLTFRARRAQRVRISVRHRSGRVAVLRRLRTVRACRRYQVRLPATVVRARISGRGGTVIARRR